MLLFPPLFWTILYDRYSPVQTLIITLLRTVMLTVPKGAWATCVVTRSHAFSHALPRLHIITWSFDWFTVLWVLQCLWLARVLAVITLKPLDQVSWDRYHLRSKDNWSLFWLFYVHFAVAPSWPDPTRSKQLSMIVFGLYCVIFSRFLSSISPA